MLVCQFQLCPRYNSLPYFVSRFLKVYPGSATNVGIHYLGVTGPLACILNRNMLDKINARLNLHSNLGTGIIPESINVGTNT